VDRGVLAGRLCHPAFRSQEDGPRPADARRHAEPAHGLLDGHPHALCRCDDLRLGSGVAGLAGVALSQIDNVSPNLGQGYIIDSFMVVVFGGVGNLWGTLVGAMTLGVFNKFLEPYAGAVLGKIMVLVFIILFIQKRPRGLFALKGRAVEA
jgi:ABC-type branched-subunit amino acid transport system permease subunit